MPSHEADPAAIHPDAAPWLAALLDHIDCGLLLVDEQARLVFANDAAQRELSGATVLVQEGRRLHTRRGADALTLFDALNAARDGHHCLVTLGEGEQPLGVTVLPAAAGTLLVWAQRPSARPEALLDFARSIALTPAETRVLGLLHRGLRPAHIAREVGVAISTIRTQIGNLRHKAGAANIRELLRLVAILPPLASTEPPDGMC